MATARLLQSLLRPSTAITTPQIHPVTLAKALYASNAGMAKSKSGGARLKPQAKGAGGRLPIRGKVQPKWKKKGPDPALAAVKKPNPGERKAFRKRIQLSNNSALHVQGLGELGRDTMTSAEGRGKLFAIPNRVLDQLRALEAFKPTQSWSLFRHPHVLVREETSELARRLQAAQEKKEAFQCVLTGKRLSGKSLVLLQAMSHALLNEWVVIHLPEGHELTNGNTDYSPIRGTSNPMQFAQQTLCLKLLQSIHQANRAVLEKLPLQLDWSNSINGLREGISLAELIQGARDGEYAWTTLRALWTELLLPGRPPVMLGLDGLGHISRVSEYRDPSHNIVHAHDLVLVRLFIDALSGKTKLPNGGAIIAATSESNVRCPPSLALAVSQREAGQAGVALTDAEMPQPDPFERGYDDRVYESLKNAHVLRVGGATKEDTRALMEYWGASGLFKDAVDGETVAQKWALAGGGIVGELERATLATMRM